MGVIKNYADSLLGVVMVLMIDFLSLELGYQREGIGFGKSRSAVDDCFVAAGRSNSRTDWSCSCSYCYCE